VPGAPPPAPADIVAADRKAFDRLGFGYLRFR